MQFMDSQAPKTVRYRITKGVKDQVDDLRNITPEHQLGLVSALEKIIANGYVHMDNHIENLGYIQNHPILFDFGFTQYRPSLDKRWALCFSIFQILEYCPESIVADTVLYRVASACVNDSYVWGKPKSGTSTQLENLYPVCGDTLLHFQEIAKILHTDESEVSSDLHLGT